MNKEFEKVKEFHRAFNCRISETPKMLEETQVNLRANWMREEIDEFCEAPDIAEQADAMIDLIYFALGTLVEMGVAPDKIFDIVHEANMAKKFADGSIGERAGDRKIIKPPEWVDPHEKIEQTIKKMQIKSK